MPFVSSHALKQWRSPLFGASSNFNHQILSYGILFLAFINTNVYIYCHLNVHANLLRPWRFPLNIDKNKNIKFIRLKIMLFRCIVIRNIYFNGVRVTRSLVLCEMFCR